MQVKELFSIIIPTWNNQPYLQCCIESIEKNSSFKHQILVHVNVGYDGTLDYLKSKNIAFTHSTENIGICKAVNTVAKLATTDFILYMNDDMYALPHWDACLKDEIDVIGHLNFSLSSTMIEAKQSSSVCVISPFDFGDITTKFDEEKLLKEFESIPVKDWSGASWPPNLVPRVLWEKVGGYSEEFSPGLYSDPDFSMKLWKAGVRVFKGVSQSRVYHFRSKSLHRIKLNDGYTQFIKKWGVTAGWFYKSCLKMGKPFTGELKEPGMDMKFLLTRIKGWYYRTFK